MSLTLLVAIFSILLLVALHELGHFFFAKKFGVRVEEFGIGLPPRLWGKKIGETLYSVNWLPFGGFVK
ncbi:MAG: site-2 protease family protein, partial [bacterium]|nr:site-2 protease family protein [bacterium]